MNLKALHTQGTPTQISLTLIKPQGCVGIFRCYYFPVTLLFKPGQIGLVTAHI